MRSFGQRGQHGRSSPRLTRAWLITFSKPIRRRYHSFLRRYAATWNSFPLWIADCPEPNGRLFRFFIRVATSLGDGSSLLYSVSRNRSSWETARSIGKWRTSHPPAIHSFRYRIQLSLVLVRSRSQTPDVTWL